MNNAALLFLMLIFSVIVGIIAGMGIICVSSLSVYLIPVYILACLIALYFIYYLMLKKYINKNSSIIWSIFFVIITVFISYWGMAFLAFLGLLMDF